LPVADQMTDPTPDVAVVAGPPVRTGERWWPALSALAVAVLLGIAAYAGSVALGAAVLVVGGVLSWGWPVLLDLPAPRSTMLTLGLAALLATTAVALTEDDPLLDWLGLAAAGGVLACFLHQLLRRDGRPRLVESLAGELMAVATLASAAAIVALPRTPGGADAVLTLAAAIAAVALVELVPLPERLFAAPAVVAAAAASALVGALAADSTAVFGAVLGLAYAIAVICVRRLFVPRPVLAFLPAALSLAMTPIAASGIVSYVLARLFLG